MNITKILVVGAGPSGCYVVDALIKTGLSLVIDVIDQAPNP